MFNTASGGAIILRNQLVEGDLSRRSFYTVGGSLSHRDVNSVAAVTAAKIGAGEVLGIKSPWKYGPFATTEEAFKRRARSPEEFSQIIGYDMADASLVYFIELAFGALTAAITENADMRVTGSVAVDGKKVLTRGMRTFGDKFSRIALFGMDSATYFDLVDQAIDNKVYEEAGVVIYGGSPGTMGKPVLVSDQIPADSIFGLQPGAVTLSESQAPGVRSYQINEQENLALGYRAEGTVNLDLLGYSWLESAGVNPDAAAVSTVGNWVKTATSNKATAGVLIDLSSGS